jgi:hypothetical protein
MCLCVCVCVCVYLSIYLSIYVCIHTYIHISSSKTLCSSSNTHLIAQHIQREREGGGGGRGGRETERERWEKCFFVSYVLRIYVCLCVRVTVLCMFVRTYERVCVCVCLFVCVCNLRRALCWTESYTILIFGSFLEYMGYPFADTFAWPGIWIRFLDNEFIQLITDIQTDKQDSRHKQKFRCCLC